MGVNNIANTDYETAKEALYAAARRSPGDYARVVSNGRWKYYKHLEFLNFAVTLLINRQIRRLMTFMPPQHGKSQYISRYTPSFYLGQYPDDHFLHASYEADFAKSWGAKARDIFETFNPDIFGVNLSKTSSSKGHWEVQGKEGSYDAFGMNGAATGKPADFINVDDPHKGRLDASSSVFQEKVYDTYTDVIETRLSKKGIINLTQTRWDVKDLSGRILDKEPSVNFEDVYADLLEGKKFNDEWVILKLPAIATENDILGRKQGDALCPDLHPLSQLLATKKEELLFHGVHYFNVTLYLKKVACSNMSSLRLFQP